ncbi:hypothetical protein AVEN_52056-1 [Araneus ventricosus]|uniref:RNase H type-1 domain-containing protein n=1 Tax=Araneus ventricosus TaxID=182803 RepID=A0A4Y2CG05_ARAVE|nr:hypothetical protein AVEN_52056-1 [Araneus ventricosus]
MPRRFAGETSVNDRKFKGSGQNGVPSRALVPTGGYSTTRCLTGRITTAAKIIALHEPDKYAQNHQKQVKIWNDSQSILKALLNQKSNSPITRSIQDCLYNTHIMRLGWIRAHVGHLGDEKADELAKEAITSTEAAVLTVLLPRSSAKQYLKQRALAKWQRRWDDGINGRFTYEVIKKVGLRNHCWLRQLIQFIAEHGPFPSYLFRFTKKNRKTKSLLAETAHPVYHRARSLPILSFPIHKTTGQLLWLWRTWHASSLCHQVPPHSFLPPQVSSRLTHRSLDEINNQPPPANKQNNRPPQLYHQPRRPT